MLSMLHFGGVLLMSEVEIAWSCLEQTWACIHWYILHEYIQCNAAVCMLVGFPCVLVFSVCIPYGFP